RTDANSFHCRRGVGCANHVEPSGDRATAIRLFANPGDRHVFAGTFSRIGSAAQNALLVFVDVHDERFVTLAPDNFLALLEIEPTVAAAILPTGRATRATVFDEEVAGVGVHVRDAPGKPLRAAHGHDGAAGERRAHGVLAVAPAKCDFVPDRWQAIDFE